MSTDAIGAAEESAPTAELGAGAAADRCTSCQAPLSPDQRYCVNCGERRGRARFAPEVLSAVAPAPADATVPPRQHRPRVSYAATLVAGVATLLIAMGVGVLIGHYSNNTTPGHTPAAQIITVGGASGAPSTVPTASKSASSTSHHRKVHAKTTVVHVTAKTAKAATAAAAKVLGSSANKNITQNATQQIGGSCGGGAGCQSGKFTGNFFPSG